MIGDPGRRIGRAVRNIDAAVSKAALTVLNGRRMPLTANAGAALNEPVSACAASPASKETTSRNPARGLFAAGTGAFGIVRFSYRSVRSNRVITISTAPMPSA